MRNFCKVVHCAVCKTLDTPHEPSHILNQVHLFKEYSLLRFPRKSNPAAGIQAGAVETAGTDAKWH